MDRRTVAHEVAIAFAGIAFDDTDMSDNIGAIIQNFQDEEISESEMKCQIRTTLEEGEFGDWVTAKVTHHLIQAGLDY